MQATSHRLGTTLQLLGNGLHLLAIPTERHHTGMLDPVGWPVSACCQLPDLPFFLFILSNPRSQDFWHLLSPFCLCVCLLSYFIIT
jgi:hypothetical protein